MAYLFKQFTGKRAITSHQSQVRHVLFRSFVASMTPSI